MTGTKEIENVVAAQGWKAVYLVDDRLCTRSLGAWAVVKTAEGKGSPVTQIVGLVAVRGKLTLADQVGGFRGYLAPEEDLGVFADRMGGIPCEETGPSMWFA
jgi:hypothetical protein